MTDMATQSRPITAESALAAVEQSVPKRICLAIPTFQRVQYLRNLLKAISELSALPDTYELSILIVDNDPQASAREIVNAELEHFPYKLRYEHCPSVGLCNVRNFILTYAKRHADFIAMLDDDELPERQWLKELLRVGEATSADAVVGPVPAILPEDAPRWLRAFRETEHPRFSDCQRLQDGWTSNCLVSIMRIVDSGLSFDPSLNFIGGEDQLFFRQLIRMGGAIVYAENAVVWEIMPEGRRRLLFILKRSFRRGNSLAMCDARMNGDSAQLFVRAAKGVFAIALGIMTLAPFEIARGAGMLTGLFGFSYQAYKRVS